MSQIKKVQFFSNLADEASDCTVKCQLALIVRYINEANEVKEDFLRMIECKKGLTGEALAETLLEGISDLDVDIMKVRGQGYDGAGAMTGHTRGVAARIMKINSKALLTHCGSHRLSLCVCSACLIQSVQNLMDHIKEVCIFFKYSEPRTKCLKHKIEKHCPEESRTKLINVCETRWVAKIEGMCIFQSLFVAIVFALKKLAKNKKKEYRTDTTAGATSLFKLLTSFDFIVTLVIVRNLLDYVLPVTIKLQSKSNDIVNAVELIESVKKHFENMRPCIDYWHSKWYQEALSLANLVEVSEAKPRTCRRQQNRENHPTDSIEDYFKVSLTIPFLEHLSMQLKERFPPDSLVAYDGLYIVPYTMLAYPKLWREKFKNFVNFYSSDFPNILALDAGMELWETHWKRVSKEQPLPATVMEALKNTISSIFPNINIALRLLGTLPTTTCECERSISALRRIKTWARSTTGESRLNGLMLLYIHRDIEVNADEVLDKFARMSSRRINLLQ